MNKSFAWSARAFLAAGLLFCAPAFAQEVAEATTAQEVVEPPTIPAEAEAQVEDDLVADAIVTAEGDESKRAWSLSAGLRSSIGQGTFMTVKNDSGWEDTVKAPDNAYDRVSLSLSLGADYTLKEFTFGVEAAMSQYLTAGGGRNEVQEFRFQDVELSASWAGYTFEATDIKFAPSLSVGLPASTISRYESLWADTSLGLRFSKNFFKKVTIAYTLSGTMFFHEYTSPAVSLEKIGYENALYRANELLSSTHIAVDGYNSQFGLSNSLSVRVPIWSTLTASVGYGLNTYWTYHHDNNDEFASEFACVGRCTTQMSSGSVSLGYGINDWLSVSAGLSSRQAPKTADNKSFRFPFWNFTGAAANMSSFSLGVSGTY